MSDFVRADINSVPGVKNVDVQQNGTLLRVKIQMQDLEYETCKKVYAKELDLYTAFPAHDFDFSLEAI